MMDKKDIRSAMTDAFEAQQDSANEVLDTIAEHFSGDAARLANIAASVALMHAQNLPVLERLVQNAPPTLCHLVDTMVDAQNNNAVNIANALLQFAVHVVLKLNPGHVPEDEVRANEYRRLFFEVTERNLTGLFNAMTVGEQQQ